MQHLYKRTISSIAFDVLNVLFFVLFTLLCIYPFWYMIIYSVSDPARAANAVLLPQGFTLFNFEKVFSLKGIGHAVFISLLRTVIGTAVTVFSCSFLGYLFSKPEMPGRAFLYRALVITMYVSGGLIPTYLVYRNYGLVNNFLVYILPTAVSAYNVILIKTFIEQLPASLEESAMIDGAGYFRVFVSIILPLSLPIIATIAVFSSVAQWNSWFDNYIYNTHESLKTLQLLLYNLINESQRIARMLQEGSSMQEAANLAQRTLTPKGVQITVTVFATIPIILVYPFMQRYFVKGLMVGAVKG